MSSPKILAGTFKGVALSTLEGNETRPSTGRVTENLFNILIHNVFYDETFSFSGKNILDLCAGSGRLGLEALSRGAKYATFIDNNPHAVTVIKKNIAKLSAEDKTDIHTLDSTKLHSKASFCPKYGPFDLIFCDAPYHTDIAEKSIQAIYQQGWLSPKPVVVIEMSRAQKDIDLAFLEPKIIKNYGATRLVFY
ncbi:MAG: 16S rRNA (guanine(966)-N(2))-methyltransferase RsmD, partial [Pseudomonadota bacterium]